MNLEDIEKSRLFQGMTVKELSHPQRAFGQRPHRLIQHFYTMVLSYVLI